MTGERQASRIRSLYLRSVLKQDLAFFDVELTTGEVVSRMSGDTVIVQDAIGEKVIALQQVKRSKNLSIIITNLYKKSCII
jgi:ATP-binding cassette subfamily B (MDR/TAP) protein 1